MSNTAGYKVHDGASITVTVPDGVTVQQGELAQIQGFFGLCEAKPKLDSAGTQDIELTVALFAISSDQCAAEAMTRGALLYFDSTTRLLTVTSGTNRVVGRVINDKDANGIVEFVMLDQHG
jgi:hypothetical protein